MVIAGKTTHIAPYWGCDHNIQSGLNQLGIRNISEQLFSILLPGLNNVSLRIRYYSFYCWIISKFYDGKDNADTKEFYSFIRKSELLLALINSLYEDSTGIPGINFASVWIQSDSQSFSLTDGTDLSSGGKTYWSNYGGIFRQYYVASLEEKGLIGRNENVSQLYNITKNPNFISGQVLAEEFDKSVGSKGSFFTETVYRGWVTRDELDELKQDFHMKFMTVSNSEKEKLIQMLLQSDTPDSPDPSFHRRATIKYLLVYLLNRRTSLKPLDFSAYMYENYTSNSENITAWGWYAYYLNDNWQYQLTRIFSDILRCLNNSPGLWTDISDITDSIVTEVAASLNIDDSIPLACAIERLRYDNTESESATAICALLAKYKENAGKLEESEMRYQELGLSAENFCSFIRLVQNSLDKSFKSFFKDLITDIIYRHYRVSFRKMLQTGIPTQKFAFENGKLRFLDNWSSTHTSPRIDTIRNFLYDTGIIKGTPTYDELTDRGLYLLKELEHEN